MKFHDFHMNFNTKTPCIYELYIPCIYELYIVVIYCRNNTGKQYRYPNVISRLMSRFEFVWVKNSFIGNSLFGQLFVYRSLPTYSLVNWGRLCGSVFSGVSPQCPPRCKGGTTKGEPAPPAMGSEAPDPEVPAGPGTPPGPSKPGPPTRWLPGTRRVP